ncbi:MAG: SDR family NAD(P)-dependent oxidoreductase [Dehalococcoidales bacterium]|nr:SDR family NAD(P)-dependent oxidoreductase [Dehalococcoidales bacterium]
MKEFKNKVAVVTGGASGIGWGLAERCAEEGMKVVIADIEGPALQQAEKTLKGGGADVLAVRTDVSKFSDIETLAQKTVGAYGGVHLLFNNAGVNTDISMRKPVWENTLADWEWMIGVNLRGVVHGIKAFMPIMEKQKTECHIVNTASMAGLIAEPQLIIYAVTKAGVVAFSEGLYLQLKKKTSPIGVSVLCPAFVSSRLFEAERNRPADLKNPPEPPRPRRRAALVKQFERVSPTLTPEQNADIVFKAIREGTFYIFTDPLVQELFRQRSENILKGKNPEPPRPG